MTSEISTIKIGDGLEVMLEGIPKSIVTPEVQAKMALSIVKHAIPMAVSITPGVIGSLQTAYLKIAGRQYEVKYALRATRVMKAAEIYSQTIEFLEFQRDRNRMDTAIANSAIEHLRLDFNEQMAYRRSVR